MRLALILSIGLAVLGCGKDSGVVGSGGSGGGGGGGGDDALDLDIGPGDVRAGRLSEDQLPDDPNGLAVWEAGDFALVNEHIAVVIEDDERFGSLPAIRWDHRRDRALRRWCSSSTAPTTTSSE